MKKILNTRIKDMKAITLIALVITIVVLIILAAVAINLSLGNNGIFNRAKTGKKLYQNAEVYERTEIGKASNKIDDITVDGDRGLTQEQLKALYSTPGNKLKDMPNTWEVGTEYYWEADGTRLYGKRFTGTFSPTKATRNIITIDTSTDTREVVNYGGIAGGFVLPFSNIYLANNNLDCAAFLSNDGKGFMFKASFDLTNPTYDIWMLYKK